jgi:hypothetical protein
VSAPLQKKKKKNLLNVLLQFANKNGIKKNTWGGPRGELPSSRLTPFLDVTALLRNGVRALGCRDGMGRQHSVENTRSLVRVHC